MGKKRIRIQNILLPNQGPQSAPWGLYYQGAENVCEVMEDGTGRLLLSHYKDYNFCSYFNGISVAKWKRYTNIRRLFVRLEMAGRFEAGIEGYHLVAESKQRRIYLKKKFDLAERTELELEIPLDVKEQIFGFSIKTYGDCEFYGGSYEAEVEEKDIRNLHIAIATTTFQKEEYIKRNVEMIKEQLLADVEMGPHWSLHVVDNGRTLSKEEIEGDGVYLHPNKNVGGAGGFTRGMIESMREREDLTHVLLMDDDVLILPESLFRTYHLLSLAKEKYHRHVISGAMLYYERMAWFHEDAGYMYNGVHRPIKVPRNMCYITNKMINENLNTEMEAGYAAWWYCCIPVELIKENGLPLPLFIRGDDIEFGVRNRVKTITMNGICLWHMGFVTKYSASMNYYQTFRNAMIMNACDDYGREDEIIAHYEDRLLEELHRFNYNAAQLILDAWNDYMKGPKFIEAVSGEGLMKEKGELNAKLRDVEELGYSVNPGDVYCMDPTNFLQKVFYRLTANGQRFWPRRWMDKEVAVISYDEFFNPQRQMFHENLLAVNLFEMQAELRTMDKVKYKRIRAYYKATRKKYEKYQERIKEAYKRRKAYLTSYEFWAKYLEIEKYQ